MWKLVPVLTAVLTLCACNSAPTVKYPTGSSTRVAINVASPTATTAGTVPPTASTYPVGTRVSNRTATKSGAVDAPPAPIPLGMFFVNSNEQTTMAMLRRWARIARVDFSWSSPIDYPITGSMRQIATTDIAQALSQVRKALEGVEQPLDIALGAQGMEVHLVEVDLPQLPTTPEPVTTAGTASNEPAGEKVRGSSAPVTTEAMTSEAAAPTQQGTPATSAVVVAAATPTTTTGAITKSWNVDKESSLREIVKKWASVEGVELRWDTARDFPVDDAVRTGAYDGDFRQALGQLATRFGGFDTPIGIRFLERGTVLRVFDIAGKS